MAEGRKLPAVFDHYIVPDATEGQFMAFVSKDFKVHSSEFYFHKPITVHIELYFCYRFIHFLQSVGQY